MNDFFHALIYGGIIATLYVFLVDNNAPILGVIGIILSSVIYFYIFRFDFFKLKRKKKIEEQRETPQNT